MIIGPVVIKTICWDLLIFSWSKQPSAQSNTEWELLELI